MSKTYTTPSVVMTLYSFAKPMTETANAASGRPRHMQILLVRARYADAFDSASAVKENCPASRRRSPKGEALAQEPSRSERWPGRARPRPLKTCTGIPTAVIHQRFIGGDSISELSADYGVATALVEDAIRCEEHRAA